MRVHQIQEDVCGCGCNADRTLDAPYDRYVDQVRAEVAVLARRIRDSHEPAIGEEVAAAAQRLLGDMAEQLMTMADHELCRRKASVYAMTTACLLELAAPKSRAPP